MFLAKEFKYVDESDVISGRVDWYLASVVPGLLSRGKLNPRMTATPKMTECFYPLLNSVSLY